MRARLKLGSLLITAGIVACGSSSTYVPKERATATLGGRTAASYQLPSETDQQGDLRLASYGISKLKQNGDSSLETMMHLRLAVSDTGSQPMTLDTREQQLQLPGGQRLAPAYASSKASAPPLILVPVGSSRTVDLFFPLPSEIRDGSDPSQFDIVWRVQVGNVSVTQVTPFEQVSVDPAVARQELAQDIMDQDLYVIDPAWGPASFGSPGWGF